MENNSFAFKNHSFLWLYLCILPLMDILCLNVHFLHEVDARISSKHLKITLASVGLSDEIIWQSYLCFSFMHWIIVTCLMLSSACGAWVSFLLKILLIFF